MFRAAWTHEDIEAVIARLDDDAAQLRDENPEDERAANMGEASAMIHAARHTLAGVPLDPSFPAFALLAHLRRQIDFSARTFGPGSRLQGVTDHIAKELKEVRESGGALAEWVDVIILAFDGAWRSGATPEQIVQAMVDKQARNEARTWPDWRTADPNKAIEHDRSHDAPSRERVYLSGPMSGIVEHNFPAFHAEAARLRAAGYDVVNPAEINTDPAATWHQCLRKDMAALSTCDTLALLPQWQISQGAHLELHVAHRLGMKIVMAQELSP